jgi:hypothetical protein
LCGVEKRCREKNMLSALLLASALSYSPPAFDDVDKMVLTMVATESVFDIMQTNWHLNNGSWGYEAAPILGRHPDAWRLWGTGILANALFVMGAKILPNPYRKIFELLVLGAETFNISDNIGRTRRYYSWKSTMSVSFW